LNTNTATLQSGLTSPRLGMTVTGSATTDPVTDLPGANPVYRDQQLVTGYLPINNLMLLPTVPDFAAVTPVYAPHFSADPGSVVSQGVAVIGADKFRQQTGKDGSGVTVGVISDSANV